MLRDITQLRERFESCCEAKSVRRARTHGGGGGREREREREIQSGALRLFLRGSGQQSVGSTQRGCPPNPGIHRCGGHGCFKWVRGPGRILLLASSPARLFTRICANNVTRQRQLCTSRGKESSPRRFSHLRAATRKRQSARAATRFTHLGRDSVRWNYEELWSIKHKVTFCAFIVL